MVYMWRKYSGSWKNKTSKRAVFTARMYSFYVNLTMLAVAGLGLSVSFSSRGRRGPMELQTMEAADALQRVALSSLCPDATTKGSHTMTQSVVPTFEMR